MKMCSFQAGTPTNAADARGVRGVFFLRMPDEELIFVCLSEHENVVVMWVIPTIALSRLILRTSIA